MSTSSPERATGLKAAAELFAAAKAALDAGSDPGLVATYLGLAAETPTAGTLRLLTALLADAVKRGKR